MPIADPDSSPADPVAGLLARAEATAFCRPALRALATELPSNDAVLATALEAAAEERNAKAFAPLYVAGLYAERPIAATILELGTPLLTDAVLLMSTALRLEGDVARALEVAIRSGRMGEEREATALIAAWLDYERREKAVPPEFLALTRKSCREAVRNNRFISRIILDHAAELSGDPVVARILGLQRDEDRAQLSRDLAHLRKKATGTGWDQTIPASPVVETSLSSGATLKRAIPKAGRNDPCPCGSGKKFKRCCFGKTSSSDEYEVGGVTIAEAADQPELVLTRERISKMRSYELYGIKPGRLVPELAADLALRLALYREIPRAIEVLQSRPPEAFSTQMLDEVANEFFKARDAKALRWIIDWAQDAVDPLFEMEVFLAPPEERLKMLAAQAQFAFDAHHAGKVHARVLFTELATAAILTDPALGILVARGVLPVCGWMHEDMLLEEIEDARDLLGLDDDEPAYDLLDTEARFSRDQSRHAHELEKARAETSERLGKRDAEISKLKTQIDALQETLAARETTAEPPPPAQQPDQRPAASVPEDSSELRELRDRLRRLKNNLKAEHDDRKRALRELRATRDQLQRISREERTAKGHTQPVPSESETDETSSAAVEWERQPLRIPDYSPAFLDALHTLPRPVATAALALAGRLAGGDPSAWKPVRALKQRPGTLRARLAGNHRLLFQPEEMNTLRILDLIPRRDLDRWLTSHKA